ncbi:MAG TPA: hypothetical protein VIA80_17405 [Hyphomonadaceae bacterium]|jgi:hypothetical protein
MHQTRAWLFAFKRAFKVSYDSPPPPNDEDMLGLLRLADKCRHGAEPEPDEESPPPEAPKPSRH